MTKQTRVFAFVLACIAGFFSVSARAATQYQAYFSSLAESSWSTSYDAAASGLAGALAGLDWGMASCNFAGVPEERPARYNFRYQKPYIKADTWVCQSGGAGFAPGASVTIDFNVRTREVVEQCAAPLVEVNGKCACPAGTKEETDANGLRQCKPDSVCSEMAGKPLGLPVTADYGSKSPSALGRMIGNSSTTCFPGGCSVSGTVSGCWSAKGVAGCNLTDAKFTGDKCDDKAPPGGCPSGSSPSQYAAGVCIPDENKCPAGSSPSKYASGVCIPDENPCPSGQAPSKYAAGVCVPKEDPNADGNGETGNNSKCPPGRVESRYAAGVCIPADTTVGDGNGGGGGTVCKDGKCTTTNPDGSEEEKPEQEFCKENPDAPQCKKSNWGGSCGSFTCDGDAIQCAIAREQHQRNCKLFDEKTSHPAYQAAVDGTDEQSADKLRGKAEQISVGTNFDQSGSGWAKACPADPEIPLGFVQQSFTIPFSRICGPLEALSLAGVGITLLGCMVWVIGGKKA